MTHAPSPARLTSRRSAGFSLTEVLIAIGLFAVGFVAVASLFPAGILLQKQTVEDMEAEFFIDNVEALIRARGFDEEIVADDYGTRDDPGDSRHDTQHVWYSRDLLPQPGNPSTDNVWRLTDRTYNATDPLDTRDLFWTPLFMDLNPLRANDPEQTDNRDWRVFIFVMRRDLNGYYPKIGARNVAIEDPEGPRPDGSNPDAPLGYPAVRSSQVNQTSPTRLNFNNTNSDGERLVRIGDKILDSNGVIYSVAISDDRYVEVEGVITGDPEVIWFADPGNTGRSALVDIITFRDQDPDDDLIQ